MATPLTPRNKRILYRSATQNAQGATATKSVVFLLEPPEPKPQVKSLKQTATKEPASTLNRFSVFDKKNNCRLMFEMTDIKGKLKSRRNQSTDRKGSPDTSFLNISDAFQYRVQPLLEEEDLVLNTTSAKTMVKNMAELEQRRNPKSKKSNIMIVKTKPRMRRRSDTSGWSGGESTLERKTVFLTFEYMAKPINLQTGYNALRNSHLQSDTPHRDTPSRGSPSLKSMSSFKVDGSPKCVSAGKKGLSHSKIVTSKTILLGNQEKGSSSQLGKESEVFGEKFILETEDNKDKEGKKDEEVLHKFLMTSKNRLDTQKSNEISDGEASQENTPAHRNNKLLEDTGKRKSGKSLTLLKERQQRRTPPKREPFNIQLKYFQPIRSVRLNATSVKANSGIKGHLTLGEVASVRQVARRDLSTGSVRTKDTPTGGTEDCYEFGARVKLLQELSNKETIEIRNLTTQTTRATQSGTLFKIHKTLVKKIHGHGRSISSLIGGIPPVIEDEQQRSAPKTSRNDNKSIQNMGNPQDKKRSLPRMDASIGAVKRRSKKNSQERSPAVKNSFETFRKTQGGDFKTLISAEEIQANFARTLRSEGLMMKSVKNGKHKPVVSDTKQVLRSYGIGK